MAKVTVSSEGLIELKNSLQKLCHNLYEVADLLVSDMTQLGQEWCDSKYEEYVIGFRPTVEHCREIASRYERWSVEVLNPLIEVAIKIEKARVIPDENGGFSSSSAVENIDETNANPVGGTDSHHSISETLKDFNIGGSQQEDDKQSISALRAAKEKLEQLQAKKTEASNRLFSSPGSNWDLTEVNFLKEKIFNENKTGRPDNFGPNWREETLQYLVKRQKGWAEGARRFSGDDERKFEFCRAEYRMLGEIIKNLNDNK